MSIKINMKKPLLLIIIFLFFFTVKNNAQNRFMTGSSASNLTNQETKTKGPHGRNNSGINSARETVLPGANQQPTKITGGAISPLVYSGYYREDFEGTFPPANWQVIDVLDPTYAWAQSPIFPYTGANSALIHYSNTGVNAEDWLIMPQFTVAPADSLSFWMGIIDPLFPPDVTQILVSTTDSALSSFTNVIDVLSEGVNYPPTDIAYVYYSYSLAAFAGQNIYVAFQNTNTFGDGVYLDRIAIGTKPPDAASKSIDIPKFAALGTFSPQATFLNDGDSIISFPVTMTSTNGYTSTKNITNLNAGATMQVTFDPWTVLTPGTIGVSIQTNLIGDTFLADDTLSTSIIIMETFTNYGWSSKTLLPVANYLGASAANNNNTASDLFLFGGYSNNLISSLADGFMPVSNMWAPANTVHAMIKGVITASAAVVKNKIYVAGGYNPNFTPANNNQIYNPQTNTWSPGFNMPSPVGDYAIGVYNDSLIYYMGGYSGSVDRSSVQIFSPSGILWIPGTALPVAADGWRGGIVGNKIVVTGGYRQTTGLAQKTTYIGTIDQANPYIISWTTGPDYPGGTLTRPASGVSLDPNSGLVLFTGGDPTGNGTQALDYTFAFDQCTSNFTGDESLTTYWAFVIKQNTITSINTIGFAIVHSNPIGIKFCNRIWATRIKRRGFFLRGFLY